MATYTFDLAGRSGAVHHHTYTDDDGLRPGSVIRVEGRDLLVQRIEPDGDGRRLIVAPARYRMVLRHPDGREEAGAMRRYRPDRPGVGHAFATLDGGRSVTWIVGDERLAQDDQGEPYLELIAQRDYAEYEQAPDQELEHALVLDDEVPPEAAAVLGNAARAGLAVELVALDPGEEPDWDEASSYIDALVIEEIDADLIDMCGVDRRRPQSTWLAAVKERLSADLESVRGDIERDHDQITEWDYRDGRVFAAVGTIEQESDPLSGHGWMCRLVDSGALSAAGFARVRKAELWPTT
jgi:hypothetical protein